VAKPKCGYGFIHHWIVNCLQYKVMDKPITIFNGIKEKCEGYFQATDTETA